VQEDFVPTLFDDAGRRRPATPSGVMRSPSASSGRRTHRASSTIGTAMGRELDVSSNAARVGGRDGGRERGVRIYERLPLASATFATGSVTASRPVSCSTPGRAPCRSAADWLPCRSSAVGSKRHDATPTEPKVRGSVSLFRPSPVVRSRGLVPDFGPSRSRRLLSRVSHPLAHRARCLPFTRTVPVTHPALPPRRASNPGFSH